MSSIETPACIFKHASRSLLEHMKSSAQPKVVAKAGSVSLSEARAAARAAKTPRFLRLLKDGVDEGSELWDRYLGHFGEAPKAKGKSRKAAPKRRSARKAALKKVAKKR